MKAILLSIEDAVVKSETNVMQMSQLLEHRGEIRILQEGPSDMTSYAE